MFETKLTETFEIALRDKKVQNFMYIYDAIWQTCFNLERGEFNNCIKRCLLTATRNVWTTYDFGDEGPDAYVELMEARMARVRKISIFVTDTMPYHSQYDNTIIMDETRRLWALFTHLHAFMECKPRLPQDILTIITESVLV
jgi:hypothetical protein